MSTVIHFIHPVCILTELENAMDCSDIVIGSAIENTSRIGDYFTVSRATPRQDSFYFGEDSITSAIGFQENGITTIIFRKPLNGTL